MSANLGRSLGRSSLRVFALVVLIFVSFASPGPARAATTWHVSKLADTTDFTCDADCSLREAIGDASSGDSIVFDVTGTITLAGSELTLSSLDLTITGPGANQLTLDANDLSRIFYIFGSTVSISGMTLTNGLSSEAVDPGGQYGGGAILSTNNAHLSLDHTVFTQNVSECSVSCGSGLRGYGGAVASSTDTSLTITHGSFTDNSATVSGGALFFQAGNDSGNDLVLTDVQFSTNHATDATVGAGGAMALYNGEDATLTDVRVSNNHAGSRGGGIYLGTFNLVTINESTIAGNQTLGSETTDRGGGISIAGSSGFLMNSTLSGNSTSGVGGAIDNASSGQVIMPNLTIAGNTAHDAPAVYANAAGSMYLYNDTIARNTVTSTGSAVLFVSGDIYLANTILSNTTGGDDCRFAGSVSAFSSNTQNLIMDYGSCDPGAYSSDPDLGMLQFNGGPTRTLAIPAASESYGNGDSSICANMLTVSGRDQRGVSRPQGTGCDIGAFELEHVFADVPVTGKEWMEPWIDAFYFEGITTGCGADPLIYCPEGSVTRASMAVFILRAKHGAAYVPPATTHTFSDMPVAGKEWMEPWVDQLYAEGITTGCGASPLIYCPEAAVTRAAMAVFLLRALEGASYVPPPATHNFSDMPVAGKEWMEPWVDEFYSRGITTGCGAAPLIYCPENPVTRASMAVFIDRAYGLYP